MAPDTISKKWPGINISENDREIVNRIRSQPGALMNIDMKDLLMLCASLAFKNNTPPFITDEARNSQIVHSTLMNSDAYSDYRQYISLIYFYTVADKSLDRMNDRTAMVKNFIDYSQRGLRMLESDYLENKEGSNKLIEDFAKQLGKFNISDYR
jgi:hypothetical protein